MSHSKKFPLRSRLSITGIGGISLSRHPTRKEGVQHRKRRGRPDMTRREYNG